MSVLLSGRYNGFVKRYKIIPVCGSVRKQGRDMQWHELGGRAVDGKIFPRSAQWITMCDGVEAGET